MIMVHGVQGEGGGYDVLQDGGCISYFSYFILICFVHQYLFSLFA